MRIEVSSQLARKPFVEVQNVFVKEKLGDSEKCIQNFGRQSLREKQKNGSHSCG
jgi:hypothetical protein